MIGSLQIKEIINIKDRIKVLRKLMKYSMQKLDYKSYCEYDSELTWMESLRDTGHVTIEKILPMIF